MLPESAFVFAGERYPFEDTVYACDAKARTSQGNIWGRPSTAEKAKVDKKAGAFVAKKGKLD